MRDLGVTLALSLAIAAASLLFQQPSRIFGDAKKYHVMADFYRAGHTGVSAEAPFVYRIATPWLAAKADPVVTPRLPRRVDKAIDDATGLDGVPGFYAVTIPAGVIAALLLAYYLRSFIDAAALRTLLVAAWLVQWHTPVRYSAFQPVNVDALFLAAVIAALIAFEKPRAVWLLPPLIFLGTLARESMALVAVAAAVHPGLSWRVRALSLAATLGALVSTTQFLGVPLYAIDPLAIPLEMLRTKPIWSWILAWFFAFGPVAIALLLASHHAVGALLRARPHLAVYLAGCALAAFFAGTDTERLLGWAYPVMLVLIGLALQEHAATLRRHPFVTALLIAIALVSARAFWPIPVGEETQTATGALRLDWASLFALADKVLVIENYYANLWSFYGSTGVHLAILAADACGVAALAWWLRRENDQAAARALKASAAGINSR